jgi:hypothetical protein
MDDSIKEETTWTIPLYNTDHLKDALRKAGASLGRDCWVFPNKESFEEFSRMIALTGAQSENKVCSSCGARKPLTSFKEDASKPDGRGKQCKECSSLRNKIKEGEITDAHLEALTKKFSTFPAISEVNQSVLDELSRYQSFAGSMVLANKLLWWERTVIPKHPERLAKTDYYPLEDMQETVKDTKCCWSTHLRTMKIILNEAFGKHVQNLRGVGYRIATSLAHDGLEAAKLHDLSTTYDGAIHKRLQEARAMFPDAPEDTKEIMTKMEAISLSHMQTNREYADLANTVISYFKERVGGGDRQVLRPPDDPVIGTEAVFMETAKLAITFGKRCGYVIEIRKEGNNDDAKEENRNSSLRELGVLGRPSGSIACETLPMVHTDSPSTGGDQLTTQCQSTEHILPSIQDDQERPIK